jgi:feruloyl-CoA synthase
VNKGLLFDGRLAEDFKLANGTWVSVGPLRARILGHFAPFVRDAVITGLNRDDLGAIIFPDLDACHALAPELPKNTLPAKIVRHSAVQARFQEFLQSFAAESTGSSNRIVRAVVAEEPPSLDAGEITDKGSFNQRAVLERRTQLVEQLYAWEPSSPILRIRPT